MSESFTMTVEDAMRIVRANAGSFQDMEAAFRANTGGPPLHHVADRLLDHQSHVHFPPLNRAHAGQS